MKEEIIESNMFNKTVLRILSEWMNHERAQLIIWFIVVMFLTIWLLLTLGCGKSPYVAGQIHLENGNYNQAIEMLTKAIAQPRYPL